ncbi:MAG: tetratricopeptide repeat protein, partial [Elusimicrobia bacterium]|nr:tetratricopeptide repeat protein [Elusimicrobiota bacterium]
MKALLLLLALCPAARAQSAAGAQRLYDQGDYAAAAVQYRALAYKEPREAAWRYDLGNCLYKSGQLGRAIASYQRAFDLAPRDGDVRF